MTVYTQRGVRILLFVWELPQNLLGILLLTICWSISLIIEIRFDQERLIIETKGPAISLGLFVFWTSHSNRWIELDKRNRDHEWGHSVQSRILGPLYLVIVGLTSQLRVFYLVVYREIRGHKWTGYFEGFPEAWADRLGGVNRSSQS